MWDSNGNQYIDCAASQGWANVGHSHPLVTEAIHRQLSTLAFVYENGDWGKGMAESWKKLAAHPLPAAPAYDGIAVAGGKVLVSLTDSTVICFGK